MGGVTGIPHRRCEKRTAATAAIAAVVQSAAHSTVGAATTTAAAAAAPGVAAVAAAPGVAAVAPSVVPGTISSTDATVVTGDDALNAVTACHRPSTTRTSTHVVAAHTICAAVVEADSATTSTGSDRDGSPSPNPSEEPRRVGTTHAVWTLWSDHEPIAACSYCFLSI